MQQLLQEQQALQEGVRDLNQVREEITADLAAELQKHSELAYLTSGDIQKAISKIDQNFGKAND